MSLQAVLAKWCGQLWTSKRSLALWPWPPIVHNMWEWTFTEDDYRCFTKHLEPGDLLLTRSQPYFVSNHFIAGTIFKHLAVYTGAVKGIKNRKHGFIERPISLGISHDHTGKTEMGEYERTITHAIGEGVVCQDILRLTNHADYVVAVRPWREKADQKAIVKYALDQVGLGYNFDFKPTGHPKFYCTGLGAAAAQAAYIDPPAPTRMRVSLLGRKGDAYLADSFVATYPAVCCSVSCLTPEFFRPSPFGDIIRQRLMKAENAGV